MSADEAEEAIQETFSSHCSAEYRLDWIAGILANYKTTKGNEQ